MDRTITRYFLRADTPGYTVTHFDVAGFYNNQYRSTNPNVVSRLRNTIIKGIDAEKLLPKFILVIPDDDLIKVVDQGFGFSDSMGRIIHHIMLEHNRIIAAHKENLPRKSRKVGYPQIVWIEAPLRVNFSNNSARVKFNTALESMAKHHENVHTLKLKKGWDDQDNSLYVYDAQHFTTLGLVNYWAAVDKTAKYVDTILLKKMSVKQQQPKDRFHWFQRDEPEQERRQLPETTTTSLKYSTLFNKN